MNAPTDENGSEERRALWKQAHELTCAGRSGEALPIYMRAVDAAKEAEDWADVANIMHDAGNAAADGGQFEYAKSLYAISLIFAERADLPPIETLGTRIEKARVEIVRGRPELVYSETTTLVQDARSLWKNAAQAPESTEHFRQTAKRYLAAALDLRRQLAIFYRQWRVYQECLEELEDLLDEDSEERAFLRLAQVNTQIDQEGGLWHSKLSRRIFEDTEVLPELRELVQKSLDDFQRLGSIVGEARAWHVLAKIEMRAHDDFLAIEYASRGFSLVPSILDPWDHAILHDNVATSWRRIQRMDKASDHWLAALVIRLATGIAWQMSLKTLMRHRKDAFRSVRRPFEPCSIADLLEKPDFLPLSPFLQSLNVSIEVLQEHVNRILGQSPGDPDPVPPRMPPTPAAPAAAAVFLEEFPTDQRHK